MWIPVSSAAENQRPGRSGRAALDSRLPCGVHPARVPVVAPPRNYIGSNFNP